MRCNKYIIFIFSVFNFLFLIKADEEHPFVYQSGNWCGSLGCKLKPEGFYNNNTQFLNNDVKEDRFLLLRHTLDLSLQVKYGKENYGFDVLEMFFSARNRSVWGDPSTVAKTTATKLTLSDLVFAEHYHNIGKQIFWLRELWLQCCLNNILHLGFPNKQFFVIGAFPFKLGRGISLGEAYALNTTLLGFQTDSAVDQYAFGMDFFGDIFKDKLAYDLYLAILENKSDSYANTSAKIYDHEYDKKNEPNRGFGKINYVIAGRLRWTPRDSESSSIYVEPYFLYNNAPEQKIEFLGDACSKLGTIGLSCELVFNRFEFGLDSAFNLGRQKVRGWDRNYVSSVVRDINSEGAITLVNDHVYDRDPLDPDAELVPYIPKSSNQEAIDNVAQTSRNNGKLIPGTTFWNASDRFRDSYHNNYNGKMLVVDGGYWLDAHKKLGVFATLAYASGDERPNKKEIDSDYKGFLGLQEIYSGNRVKSIFMLEARRLKRPLASTTAPKKNEYAANVSEFTNLLFVGAGIHWHPLSCKKELSIKPNMLSYWQSHRPNKIDISNYEPVVNEYFSRFLGFEFNCQLEYIPFPHIRTNLQGALFIPGAFYDQIKGLEVKKGVRMSNDLSYLLAAGIELRF